MKWIAVRKALTVHECKPGLHMQFIINGNNTPAEIVRHATALPELRQLALNFLCYDGQKVFAGLQFQLCTAPQRMRELFWCEQHDDRL